MYKQLNAGVRFDWGLAGARSLAPTTGCLVVIDVLSFTTTVSVAVSKDMAVFPYPWRDSTASDFALEHDAVLAVGRSEMSPETPWSLSAAALQSAPMTPRLVLPSPNGSAISAASEGLVVAASLRNGREVATRLLEAGYGTTTRPVAVIASGERWSSDESLRPSIEDLLGAGYVIAEMQKEGCVTSVEAQVAMSAYRGADDIASTVRESASGCELIEDGFGADVEIAIEVDADAVVPVLSAGAFVESTADQLREPTRGADRSR